MTVYSLTQIYLYKICVGLDLFHKDLKLWVCWLPVYSGKAGDFGVNIFIIIDCACGHDHLLIVENK